MPQREHPKRLVAALVAGLVALGGAGAGSCGPETDPRERPPDTDGRADDGTVDGPVRRTGDRHSTMAVPDGMRPEAIRFLDAHTGYAMFRGCAERCAGALFATFDGGQSWVERPLPVVEADHLSTIVVDAATVVVLTAAPGGWFRSTDGGRTFSPGGAGVPAPAELSRGVSVGCPTAADCPGQVLLDGRPLPAQPPGPGEVRDAVRAPDGVIWAVSAANAVVSTARSSDGGGSWQPVGGPLHTDSAAVAGLRVSVDGRDMWLVTGPGIALASVFKLDGSVWRKVDPAVNLEGGAVASAAVGEGVLAVAGETRFGYIDSGGRWLRTHEPVAAQRLEVLPDGTVVSMTASNDVWLGTGSGAARTWNHVTVEAG